MISFTTLHGTMMCVYGCGILITGQPGIGKSLLAYRLLDRGHQLISDDATDIFFSSQFLIARCPPTISNWLWINTRGLIVVTKCWGKKSLKVEQHLDLILHLQKESNLVKGKFKLYRTDQNIFGITVPKITLETLNINQNLSLLVENISNFQQLF